MKKMFMMMVVAMITMFAATSFAYTPLAAPANGGYVVDTSGKLSADQISQLNNRIETLNKTTRNEYGILLLQDMGGDNIEDVAHATFNAWGVGKEGLDNGVLIVVAVKERKSRIETGKGVGGELPDLRANQILKENLNPFLKSGDFYGGFKSTLDATSGYLEARANQKSAPSGCAVTALTASTADGMFIGIVAIGILGMIAFFVLRSRARENEKLARLNAAMRAQAERQAMLKKQADAARDEAFKRAEADRVREVKAARASQVEFENKPVSKPAKLTPPKPDAKEIAAQLQSAVNKLASEHTRQVQSFATKVAVATSAVASAVAQQENVAAQALARRESEAREAQARKQREESNRRDAERREAEARRRREDDDRRRKERDEESRRSSSSSWSSGSSSDSGSSGFGGGDSGGGGSSSDW